MDISTHFVYPPIPIRDFDWSAVDRNRYDGEGCPSGAGATEAEAIENLLESIDFWEQCIEDRHAAVGETPFGWSPIYVSRPGETPKLAAWTSYDDEPDFAIRRAGLTQDMVEACTVVNGEGAVHYAITAKA